MAFTNVSDKTKKENFQPVDGEEVLGKIELKRIQSLFEPNPWKRTAFIDSVNK